jgi:hypothetical protein
MKRFILLLLFLVPALLQAQSNYQKGYVVTNNQDTLHGFINYHEKSNNASTLQFKRTLDSKAESYDLNTAKAYSIAGIESYERYIVSLSQGSNGLSRLAYGPDTTSVRNTVFLKVIQTGKNVSFYSFTDDIKTRFYLLDKGEKEPEELISSVYLLNGSGKTKVIDRYRRQMVASMMKHLVYSASDERRLGSLAYTSSALLREVSKINGQEVEKGKAHYRFFAGAGLSLNKTNYSGESQFNTPGATNKASYTPMITAGIDLLANPNIGRLIYRLEFSFMTVKVDIRTENVEPIYAYRNHTFEGINFGFTPQVLYNFFNTPALKVYAGIGVGLHVSKYKNNQTATKIIATDVLRIEKNKTEVESYHTAPAATAGIVLRKRFEIFGQVYFNSPLTTYTEYAVNLQRTNIGVKYIISKK